MRLGQLTKNLRALSKLPSQISKVVAEELEELIDSQFQKGVDPYGRPWARLKNGTRSHLQKTGQLRNSLEVRAAPGAGIRIRISDVARYHQTGTKWMPARPILPGKDLPADWVQRVARVYADQMRKNARR